MKKFFVALSASLVLASAADASTVGFGFKSVDGVADGATELLWDNGGITLSQTADILTVNIWGRENLTAPVTAWVIDWSKPMATTDKFDLYLNKVDNSYCHILATPIVDDWVAGTPTMFWDQATQSDGGYCGHNQNAATLTAAINPIPLPAGGLLILTGLASFGAMRRMAKRKS